MTTDDDVTRPKPEAPDLLAWMREFQASLPPADPAPPITEGQQQFWQQALLGLPPPEPPPAPAEPSAAELARELLRVHGGRTSRRAPESDRRHARGRGARPRRPPQSRRHRPGATRQRKGPAPAGCEAAPLTPSTTIMTSGRSRRPPAIDPERRKMTQPIDVAAALERRRRQEQTQSDAEMDAIAAELQAAIPTDLSGLAARARVLVRWLRYSPSADEDVQGLAESLAEGLAALLKGGNPAA